MRQRKIIQIRGQTGVGSRQASIPRPLMNVVTSNLLLALLPLPPLQQRWPPSALQGHGRHASRPRCCASAETNVASAAARLLQKPQAASGFDAFAGTAWQVLMQMEVGGTAMFSVELLEDTRCRFSDTDMYGADRTAAPHCATPRA